MIVIFGSEFKIFSKKFGKLPLVLNMSFAHTMWNIVADADN